MRILHAVTLVSPNNEFGGPTRVALNLARELEKRGHSVAFLAGARGYEKLPRTVEGIECRLGRVARLLPGAGFSGLVAPSLYRIGWTELGHADLLHVHLARDLITLPLAMIALARGVPVVVQTHGMVDRSEKHLARILDAVATKWVIRRAKTVCYLSSSELADLRDVFGEKPNFAELPNGIEIREAEPTETSQGGPAEFVFLARISERKRPLLFVEASREAVSLGAVDSTYTLYGPDEGLGAAVTAALAENDGGGRIEWKGALPPEDVAPQLANADVLVNTTSYDPFPMAVLEALALGVPVIIGSSSPLARGIHDAGAGVVVDETVSAFAEAMNRFASNREFRRSASVRAREYASEKFNINAVADKLVKIYQRSVS